jgi:heme-degrading monooxygenase HmoA
MIVVIVHHWCKPDMVDAARRRVDENGDSSAAAPGFLFRYRLARPDEPLRMSTVTAWTSAEAYRQWKDERNKYDAAAGAVSPYERAVNEIFEVKRTHGDVPSELLEA